MTNMSLRAKLFACALLAGTALAATPALAQSASAPAPLHSNVDGNGVDLVTGKFRFALAEASIGAGEGAVSLMRYWGDSTYRDNWSGGLYVGSDGNTYVEMGGLADSFSWNGSAYVPVTGDGATLTRSGGDYTYTSGDGTQIAFRSTSDSGFAIQGYSCPNGIAVGSCAIPTSMTRPNGVRFTINFDITEKCDLSNFCETGTGFFRFRGVSSSAGYSFTVNYASDNAGTGSAPQTAWYQKTGVTFANAVTSCDSSCPSLSYSTSGGITTVTDGLSRVWRLNASTTQLTGIRRPGASSDTTTVTYDTNALVSSITREGVTTNYSRSVSGNIVTMTVTDALSHSKVVTSDLAKQRITSVQDELGHTTSFQYDTSGRVTRTTAPEGNYVAYSYDARGNVTQTQAVAKDGTTTLTASASYPSSCTSTITCNKPTSTTDARGNSTDYTYDSTHGGVLTVTAPAPTTGATRPQARYSYTLTSSPVSGEPSAYLLTGTSACVTGSSCTGTSDEVKATVAYNSNFLPSSSSAGAGDASLTATTAMTYDPAGNLLTVDGPLSGTADTTRTRYNAARQVVGVVSPDPDGAGSMKMRAVRNTYDSHGFLTKVEKGTVNSQSDTDWAGFSSLQEVDTSYDANGRPTTQSVVSGSTTYALTQRSYDALGRVQCTAQRMNPAAFGSLPSDACTLGTAGSYGNDRIAKTGYDYLSRPSLVQSAYGVTGVQADEVATAYTDNGRTASVTDAEGNKTSYVYDGFDRLYQTLYPSAAKGVGTSNSSDYEQLGYDANGNVTGRRNRGNESASLTYDALNRLTYKDLPGSEPDVTYSYDLLGRLTGASQSGNALSFTYDALGRNLTQAGPRGTVTSTYDIAGRRTRLTHPDGFYVDQEYLITGELTKIRENGATSGVGVLVSYAYDDLGRRTSNTRGDGSNTSYTYDSASRLTQLAEDLAGTSYDQTLGFSYNPAAQIIQNTHSNDTYAWAGHYNINRGYTANGLNQYTASGSVTPAYDSRGNITSAGSMTYTYSSENLLTSASGGITLGYDPAMRLYQIAGGTPSTTRLQYDGTDLIAEYDESNSLQRRFIHGPGIDEPLVWYEGSGTNDRRFLHSDERGSVVAIGSGSSTVVNTYDEYGIPRSSNTGRFQYTGQTWLPELGMYYYKGRIYSPTLGRFLQTDPIGYGDGLNLHTYAHSDPVNGTDPSGTTCEESLSVTGGLPCSLEPPWSFAPKKQDSDGGSAAGAVDGGEIIVNYVKTTGADWGASGYMNNWWPDLHFGQVMLDYWRDEYAWQHALKVPPPPERSYLGVINDGGRTLLTALPKPGSSAATKVDSYHQPNYLVQIMASYYGSHYSYTGGDGGLYQLTQILGGMYNQSARAMESGVYEYIVNSSGQLTHQRFIPGGVITGFPNQKAR